MARRDRGRGHARRSVSRRRSRSSRARSRSARHTSAAPDRAFFALRGSGQGLYVGIAEDEFVVASEPYGLVEETHTYLRLDGETPANPDNPGASRGQLVVLDAAHAGTLAGITRLAYDGTVLPVTEADLVVAEITTRDIDRGEFPHYLLKEITESPDSFRTTLRGKLVERAGLLHVALPDTTIPTDLRARLGEGAIRRVIVIGQGTAAVAGRASPPRSPMPSAPATRCASRRSSRPSCRDSA